MLFVKKLTRKLIILAIGSCALAFNANAGEKIVYGTITNPGTTNVIQYDGTSTYPSIELSIPPWNPTGLFRSDGSPVQYYDLEKVEFDIQQNTFSWTKVENNTSIPRGWWAYMAGSRQYFSKHNMAGVADPMNSGYLAKDGVTTSYGSLWESLSNFDGTLDGAGPSGHSGYYWGPENPKSSFWVGEGDRREILYWSRPTAGYNGNIRLYLAPRYEGEFMGWEGHIWNQAKVDVSFNDVNTSIPGTQFRVKYIYRNGPTGGPAVKAISTGWTSTGFEAYTEPAEQYEVPGFSGDPSKVRRVIVEYKPRHLIGYGIENTSNFGAVCGGAGYSSPDFWLGPVHMTEGFSFGVGSPPQQNLPSFDGSTDWEGPSGLRVYNNRPIDFTTYIADSDIHWPNVGYMDPWWLGVLTQPTMILTKPANTISTLNPVPSTPGATFAWDGTIFQGVLYRITYFVEL